MYDISSSMNAVIKDQYESFLISDSVLFTYLPA